MSGHSKWANIRVRKGAQDAKRGKVYTRHARLIEIAAQRGGDPAMNASLRAAIDNAKAENVPNANIDRAIKKGTGELQGARMEEMMFACYAPGGVACLIECLSDNRNRTIANVKATVNKRGGTWAESSSVLWMFERKGVVTANHESKIMNQEECELVLIDAGAEDISWDDPTSPDGLRGASVTVISDPSSWTKIRDALKSTGFAIGNVGLKYLPTQKVAASGEVAEKLLAFVDVLEEDDDVAEVHTNADIV
jgi:YebC/PmpR family DNA-binding regulatory protein